MLLHVTEHRHTTKIHQGEGRRGVHLEDSARRG